MGEIEGLSKIWPRGTAEGLASTVLSDAVVRRPPVHEDYAPYHTHQAFAQGVAAHGSADYRSREVLAALDGVALQAWDRGLEYAMRVAAWRK